MSPDNDFKAICSVTEMARNLGLSRARFYQLQNLGVFPRPVYCVRSKRPFYPLDLQQKCMDVRRTGVGSDGRPILFNSRRKNSSKKPQHGPEQKCQQLTDILNQMGLKVSSGKVRDAVKVLYPEGLTERSAEDTVIRDLFRYFEREP
jgi:hypothetical protein